MVSEFRVHTLQNKDIIRIKAYLCNIKVKRRSKKRGEHELVITEPEATKCFKPWPNEDESW